jgi:hypothetical protein
MIEISPDILFCEAMPNAHRDNDNYLLTTIKIGNCLFHVEAVAVHKLCGGSEFGQYAAIDAERHPTVELAFAMSDAGLTVMDYLNKKWVVVIYPYAP